MLLSIALASVTITFPMEAEVRGTEVTLGDIATVTGDDPVEVAKVEATSLGGAPTPGYTRLFQAIRVEQLVERRTGFEVTVAGHRACRVRPVVEIVPAEVVVDTARAELQLQLAGLDFEIELEQGPGAVQVPAGDSGWSLQAHLTRDSIRTGNVAVPVRVLVDGGIYRTVWTRWKVGIYESRTVLGRPVRAGERLMPEDFAQARIAVPTPGAANPLRGKRLVGAIATRDLDASQMITELDLHRPIAIRRGDSVHLQVKKGPIVARVPVVARQDASIGDRIVVSIGERDRTAVVLTPVLVEIDLGTSPKR